MTGTRVLLPTVIGSPITVLVLTRCSSLETRASMLSFNMLSNLLLFCAIDATIDARMGFWNRKFPLNHSSWMGMMVAFSCQ